MRHENEDTKGTLNGDIKRKTWKGDIQRIHEKEDTKMRQ